MKRRDALRMGATGLALTASPLRLARAEAAQVRLSHGYGIHFLPMMVMRHRNMLEKHAARLGLGKLAVEWRTVDGGSGINEAMLAGSLDIAGTGAPGFITLWAKARNIPASAVTGVCALGAGALWLNTNNPNIRSLRDFTDKDRIAVPGIKTSFAAVILQIAAAREFGIENYAKLDPITVSLSHPDALVALVGGKSEITGHFTSPPFSYEELKYPNVHRVVSSSELMGPITIDVVFAPKRFADANPTIMEAFLAAKDEADALIASNKDAATESYVSVSNVKMAPAAIRQMLDDPETTYTASPDGIMKYVDFMAQAGLIKTRPAVWTELFIPQMAGRKGS